MLKVFRFMGMPDKVLAFDNLPDGYSNAFEFCRADGFPRHWKEWMGKIQKKTNIPPEKDLMTGQVRRFEPIIEEDSFFYLVDFNLKQNEEKWQETCDYIRRTVDKEVRLMDKIEDMAKPLGRDKSDSVSLEPEEVTVIKLPSDIPFIIKNVPHGTIENKEEVKKEPAKEKIKCVEAGCDKEFDDKRGIRMHMMKKHPVKIEVPV